MYDIPYLHAKMAEGVQTYVLLKLGLLDRLTSPSGKWIGTWLKKIKFV
jgi:hypothetical protein